MRRYLKENEWRELKQYCDDQSITFFSTATFEEEVDFLVELGCETIKICSGDVTHLPFISYCAKTGLCIQLDTGNATIGEVERAVDTVLAEGNDKIIIHNCPSGYPARLTSINLRIIPTLKKMFECPVAFSDHTPGWEMDIAAVAIGANMLEKTITFDRCTPSVEHIFSLEPEDMKKFIQSIRDIETALGSPRRIMYPAEKEKSLAVRRSIVIKKDVKTDQILDESMIDFSRPGDGLGPEMLDSVLGRKLSKDLPKGHKLSIGDLY